MKLSGRKFSQALAGEYALGTMQGAAKKRFERSLVRDSDLQRELWAWENHLFGLSEVLPRVQPPERVWNTIEKRIGASPSPAKRLWDRLDFWRPFAILSTALAFCLLLFLGYQQWNGGAPVPRMVAYLNDPTAQPAWLMTLDLKSKSFSAQALHPPPIGPDQALELWMLPGQDQRPISLGLLPTTGSKVVALTDEKYRALISASGLAVSLEPKGGSPTGAPTGPVLYQGSLQTL